MSGRIRQPSPAVTDQQWQMINWCVRATQSLRIPKSVGEIFGLIFSSEVALSFDDVVGLLGISAGSASYGLRALRRMGAIKTTYEPRSHRDYYIPEVSLRKLLNGFLAEVVLLHLGGTRETLEALAESLRSAGENEVGETLLARTEVLLQWNHQVGTALRAALDTLP